MRPTGSSAPLPQVATLYFEALAAAAKRSADTGAGRRRMLAAGTLELTLAQALQELVAAFLIEARQQLQAGDLYTPDPVVVMVSQCRPTSLPQACAAISASSAAGLLHFYARQGLKTRQGCPSRIKSKASDRH